MSHQHSWKNALLPRKNASNSTSQPGWVARRTCLSFSPNTAIEVVHLYQASVDNTLLGLLGPYHWHVISTFNTCSWGSTHRSLTDTDGGYNLIAVGLPHHTPRPFQPINLHFSPKGLTWSQDINPTITSWTRDWTSPKSHEWEPPLDFYHNLSSKDSMC
jgi:hypothetical protein